LEKANSHLRVAFLFARRFPLSRDGCEVSLAPRGWFVYHP